MDKLNIDINDEKLLNILGDNLNICFRINEIRNKFGFEDRVNVLCINNKNDMKKIIECDIPDWVIALNNDNTIILYNLDNWENKSSDFIIQIIVHEFVHIVLNYITNNTCPIYLNEGLALYYANQNQNIDFKYLVELIKNEKFELEDLDYEHDHFYDLSILIMDMFIIKYGEREVIEFIRSLNWDMFSKNNLKL
ncbi:hypothetical protein [Tepidibacter hydrothermalis]|uniref:Peptidase MA-like domain-containing protein n=1 Tax=Tepidibacter hydrothermalis TaxID=3036126 RepID=A0ABY8EG89_9FIRM|nr:hypothetical protein [Tepidibacter hydrothermalis]WFD10769.1 hypothetical protein P4S50_01450 [Tepidibacter hydrothermalis]